MWDCTPVMEVKFIAHYKTAIIYISWLYFLLKIYDTHLGVHKLSLMYTA